MPEINEQGLVAMKYMQPQDRVIRVGGEKYYRDYVFRVGRAGLSMCWVQPSDVPEILKIMRGCCNSQAPAFRYANAGDVRVYTGVAER